jgi:hypothetical protein
MRVITSKSAAYEWNNAFSALSQLHLDGLGYTHGLSQVVNLNGPTMLRIRRDDGGL